MCSFAKKEQQEGIPSCCSFFLREKGLEPPRHGHQILSLARLPIPPFPLIECYCLLFALFLLFWHKKKVGEGIRTLDLQSHNLAP